MCGCRLEMSGCSLRLLLLLYMFDSLRCRDSGLRAASAVAIVATSAITAFAGSMFFITLNPEP